VKAKVGDTVELTAAGIEHVEQFVHIDDAERWTSAMEGEVERVIDHPIFGEVAYVRFPVRMDEDGENPDPDPYIWELAAFEYEVVRQAVIP
jgi:hypothetical protein